MKVLIVTGGIGSGKSVVCGILESKGIPVYDSDSRVKSLYKSYPSLAAMVTPDLFVRPEELKRLEDALYPVLEKDFREWAVSTGKPLVAFESAIVLGKSYFDAFGDYVMYIDAPVELRKERVLLRGGITEVSLEQRIAIQRNERNNPRVDCIIDNTGTVACLETQINDFLNNIDYGKREN